MSMKVIIISGTPGTGKTTLSKKLAKILGCRCIDVNEVVKKNRLNKTYDKKKQCFAVDISKLNKALIKIINDSKKQGKEKYLIIDSHLSHYLPKKYIDLCVVAKCNIKKLGKRLKKKRFHKEKIKENIQAEIFDVCFNEALERKHNVLVVDTTKGFNIQSIAKHLGG